MKTWYLEDWNHFNIEVTGRYVKGQPAKTNDIPERCYEGEGPTIKNLKVYCGARDITANITQEGIEQIINDIIDIEESS